jgi:hypothetical protein
MSPKAEKRRSRRYQSALEVEITDRTGTRRGRAVDVARHGLFLALQDLPPNRHLVQLRILLPDGDIRAAATVSRAERGQGVGLSLFALSDDARARWDDFVLGAHARWTHDRARQTAQPADRPSTTPPGFRGSTFFLRLRDVERLRDYRRQHVDAGGTILFTPALLPAGSPVTIIVVHPATQAEYPLTGSVHRAISATPKRLEILFHEADGDAFQRFVDRGSTPPIRATTSVLPSAAVDSGELEFDIDDADIGDEPVAWELRCAVPGGDAAIGDDTGDFEDVDITVETRDLTVRSSEAAPVSLDSLVDKPVADAVHARARRVRIGCDRCAAAPYVVVLGRCPGSLGLVADLAPLWSPRAGRIVTVPRLVAAKVRAARAAEQRRAEAGGAAVPVVALDDVLAAAALADEPRHPETGEALRTTRAVERVAAASQRLADVDDVAATRVPCPACSGGHLQLRLASPTATPTESR